MGRSVAALYGSTGTVCEAVSACEGEAVVCKCGFVYVVWETVCKGSSLERVYLRVSIWLVSVVACARESGCCLGMCLCLCDLTPVGRSVGVLISQCVSDIV